MVQRPNLKLQSADDEQDEQPGSYANPLPDLSEASTPESNPAPAPMYNTPPLTAEQEKARLVKEATDFGATRGKGDVAFVRFARLCVQGGQAQTLSGSPKSQDAKDMYGAFSKGRKKAATISDGVTVEDDEKAAKSDDAQLSKVRALIKLGWNYSATKEGELIFEDALSVHGKLLADRKTADKLKLRSTYAAIVSIAVAQNKVESKVRMTTAEIEAVLSKDDEPEKPATTGIDMILNAAVLITSAMKGKEETDNRAGRVPVDHSDLPHIVTAIRNVVGQLDKAKLDTHDAAIVAAQVKKDAAKQKKIDDDKAKADTKAQKEANLKAKAQAIVDAENAKLHPQHTESNAGDEGPDYEPDEEDDAELEAMRQAEEENDE